MCCAGCWNANSPSSWRAILTSCASQSNLKLRPLAATLQSTDDLTAIRPGLAQMEAADRGDGDPLDADVAFHVAILRASHNPFYAQFQMVMATALRTSIRFTNRIKGRTANIEDHAAVATAIKAHDVEGTRLSMQRIIGDVLELIAEE